MEIGFITADEITDQYPTLAQPATRVAGHNGETATLTHYYITATDANGNPTAVTPIYVEDEPEQTDLDDYIEQRIEEGYYRD